MGNGVIGQVLQDSGVVTVVSDGWDGADDSENASPQACKALAANC